MRSINILLLTFFWGLIPLTLFAQKEIIFFQTDWGNELPMDTFLTKVKADGYHGIEVWMPGSDEAKANLKTGLKKYDLKVIFLNGTNRGLALEEALKSYETGLREILAWEPVKVNNHTGNDFWTEDQNLKFIELADKLSKESGIPIIHETHRGRFSYTLPAAVSMLERSCSLLDQQTN